jgi:hypothetical protein
MTWKKAVSAQDVVDLLNEMLEKDPIATRELCETRVPCNQDIADHESIQVTSNPEKTNPRVGIIGVLNGFFGVDSKGYGPIAMNVDEETGDILKFEINQEG